MTSRRFIASGILTSLIVFTQAAFAQSESPATIPASIAGTYDLSYSQSTAGGPFVNGGTVKLAIGTDGTLCINDRSLSSPVLLNGNPAEAVWKDSASSINYAVSNLQSGFNEVNVASAQGTFYGQLTGSKTSDAINCELSGPIAVTDAMNTIFQLAESKVPEYFPAGAITLFFENYVYRFYPQTGIYLAFADSNVFVLGGAFGDAIVDAGSTSSVITTLNAHPGPNSGSNSGSGSSNPQLWNLTISGTVTTTTLGIGNTINFQGLSLADVPAPDLSNTDEINQEIVSSLDGIASGISNISITVVNNTDTRRTFDVSFSATAIAPGVSISYQLTYDYQN